MQLKIYMKSGNVLKLPGVKDWEAKWRSDEITYLRVIYKWWAREKLLVGTINLSQIEAIVKIGG